MDSAKTAFLREDSAGVRIKVRIQPKASRNEIVGLLGNALKIRIAAPPVDDAANQQLIQFLSKTWSLSKSSIQIIQGQSSRNKTILLQDMKIKTLPLALLHLNKSS